jgi:hypothetical protein
VSAVFGAQGVPLLAEALRLPAHTGKNSERGAKISAAVFLRFIEISGASVLWLRTGQGERFLVRDRPGAPAPSVVGGDHS